MTIYEFSAHIINGAFLWQNQWNSASSHGCHEYYIISQECWWKPPPSCRDLLAVPPRHRSMGPLSVVLGGARPWWPYRLLDLLLVIITALMTGHTWAVSIMILSFVLSCLQARWWARALGSTPWISTPRLERESLWRISRSDILYTVTDNVKCYIWCVLVTEEGVRQDHLPGRVQRHGGQGAVAPGTLLLHHLHAVSSSC